MHVAAAKDWAANVDAHPIVSGTVYSSQVVDVWTGPTPAHRLLDAHGRLFRAKHMAWPSDVPCKNPTDTRQQHHTLYWRQATESPCCGNWARLRWGVACACWGIEESTLPVAPHASGSTPAGRAAYARASIAVKASK